MDMHKLGLYALIGAVGGFVNVLLSHGCFELPKIKNGKIYFGGFFGVVMGAIAGMVGDSHPVNAFFWGMGGPRILSELLTRANAIVPNINDLTEKDGK